MEFKDRLRELRHEHKVSQAELGVVMGRGWTYVSRLESGDISPVLSDLVKLRDLFEVSMAYLIGESDQREDK